MSLLLALALIVRVGIRAGETELYKYWQLFSGLAEPTFICDKLGLIILANPAMVKTFGFTEERQIEGKSLFTIFGEKTLPSDLLSKASQQECSLEVEYPPQQIPFKLSLGPIFSENRKVLIAGPSRMETEDQVRRVGDGLSTRG